VNRTSADVILLCSASVRTKSSASRVMTLVITSRAGHHPAKIAKIEWERSRFRSHSIAMEDRDLDINLDDRNSTSYATNQQLGVRTVGRVLLAILTIA